MAGKQVSGDGIPPSLAGMSKNQLYDIMCQMKTLIEQNKQQARQILIQNPALTKALFQAQIMLGMVQTPQASPAISSTVSQNPQPAAMSNQPHNTQVSVPVSGQIGQNQIRKQQLNQPMVSTNPPMVSNPPSQPLPPLNPQPQAMPSHPLQPTQQPKGHLGSQSTPMSIPQPSQVPSLAQLPLHTNPQPPSLHQLPMPSLSTQSQQPLPNTGSQYMPLQPPLPPQPRPPMQGFPHQAQAQMGPNSGFQHPSGPQMHHPQHMYHSGSKPPVGMGPPFPQGQLPLPNQPLSQSVYQAGSPHLGMDFNQVGSSKQTDRGGSNWMPGLPENTMGQLLGPQSTFPGLAGPGPSNQLARPPSLTPELEKALLQQVMSLTPEQINMLPTEQRNQVLQLQQMLRQ